MISYIRFPKCLGEEIDFSRTDANFILFIGKKEGLSGS